MTVLYKPLRQGSRPSLLTHNPSDLEGDVDDQYNPPSKASSWRVKALLLALFCSVSLNLLFLWRGSYNPAVATVDPIWGVQEPLYSPAQRAIKYERVVYTELGRTDKYYGPPTNETDEAWRALYNNVGFSRIDDYEAALLPNKTERLAGDEGHHIIQLDVFHQLHCLNGIRMAFYPERYPPLPPDEVFPGQPFDHTDHCINYLRQAIMCNADITPVVWKWENWRHKSIPRFDVPHTCRSWDSIYQWAVDHALVEPLNDRIHVLAN